MSASDLQWLGALGLAVGGLGAIIASGRPSPPWVVAVLLGGAGAFVGGYAMHMLFGAQFPDTRRAVSGMVAALFVGSYALYARSRRSAR